MKTKIVWCLVLLSLFVLVSADVYKHPDGTICNYKFLDIEPIGQKSHSWCWAASAEMIFKKYNKSIPQCKQASKAIGMDIDCCKNPSNNNCIKKKGNWPDFQLGNLNFCGKKDEKGLPFHELKLQLDKEKPIGFAWKWTEKESGHYMVAQGYVEVEGVRLVIVNDPLPVNHGSMKIMTYQFFIDWEKHHEHWRTNYNFTIDTGQDINCEPVAPPVQTGLNPIISDAKNPGEAAARSLKILKHLPPEILTQPGLTPVHKVKNCELLSREGMDGFDFSLSDLRKFRSNILKDSSKWFDRKRILVYFVKSGQDVLLSIQLRKLNNKWHFVKFDTQLPVINTSMDLLSELSPNTQKSKYFILEIPGVQILCLGYFDRKHKLNIILPSEYSTMSLDSKGHILAEEFFKKLEPSIKIYENILKPPDEE